MNYHDIMRQRVYNSLRQSQVTDKQHRIELIPKLVQYWRGFCCFLDPNWLYTLTFIGCQLFLQVLNVVPISTGQVLLQDMKPHTNHVWRQPVPSYQPHVWEASPRTTLPNTSSEKRWGATFVTTMALPYTTFKYLHVPLSNLGFVVILYHIVTVRPTLPASTKHQPHYLWYCFSKPLFPFQSVKLKLPNSWRGIPTGNLWVSSRTRTTDYLNELTELRLSTARLPTSWESQAYSMWC